VGGGYRRAPFGATRFCPVSLGPEAGSWRRGRDSNPRYPCEYAAFRVRCFQPLSHLSEAASPRRMVLETQVILNDFRRDRVTSCCVTLGPLFVSRSDLQLRHLARPLPALLRHAPATAVDLKFPCAAMLIVLVACRRRQGHAGAKAASRLARDRYRRWLMLPHSSRSMWGVALPLPSVRAWGETASRPGAKLVNVVMT
jgi:hypothetical protein